MQNHLCVPLAPPPRQRQCPGGSRRQSECPASASGRGVGSSPTGNVVEPKEVAGNKIRGLLPQAAPTGVGPPMPTFPSPAPARGLVPFCDPP